MLKIAFSPAEAAAAVGLGRSKFYELIREGRITTKKSGSRTLITVAELKRFVDDLPQTELPQSDLDVGGEA